MTDDPGAKEQAAKHGNLSLRLGLGWAKSHTLHTGQTPVLKYNRQLMQAILWGRLPIVIGLYVITYVVDLFPSGDPGRDFVWWLHVSFGLLLFGLVALRTGLRLSVGAPALPPTLTDVERRLAHGTHVVLYVLLISVPALGVVLTWLRGEALSLVGLFTIPAPFPPDRPTAGSVRELHNLGANLILAVAGLHAAARSPRRRIEANAAGRARVPDRAYDPPLAP